MSGVVWNVSDEKMPAFLQICPRRPSIRTLLFVSLLYSFILSAAYLSFVLKSRGPITGSSQQAKPHLKELKRAREMLDIVKASAEQRKLPTDQEYTHNKIHWSYHSLPGEKLLHMQCSKCAVVSSSGHLINSSLGREIDSTPCVFRMNNAPVTGYETDVGSRTTVRSIGHVNLEKSFGDNEEASREMLTDNRTRASVVLINWMSKTKIKKFISKEYRFALLLAHLFPDVKFYSFTRDKMISSEALFKNYTGLSRKEAQTWLSTGWYTLIAAIDICKEIVVYGMANEDYCTSSMEDAQRIPYHYYEPNKLKECSYFNQSETRLTGGHLFITEKAVFARLAAKRKIQFKHPAWPERNFGAAVTLDTPFLQHYWRNKRYQEKHRRRRVVPRNHSNAVQLRMGNKTITVPKEQLLDKIVELLPGSKVLLGPGNATDVKGNFSGSGDRSS
ncbi:alpha-N-acetyl-neuraminyl-2,3-beta-galactosyl-1,3-N-acetyl-galactosaminide alpha-2,6-sialyltransferase-like [Patiria miniata]|uniref:Uncharacterized protein n=1 Tax=Patiria miniata TaxID=46514 RepID=A0A913Z882_PATMI|nr:alpha-N-acetyl-neuraminyl-2,3-beta-galactosyl-1,3-N-acetyl-galactosaminide alpha-2,6-sialyltransferase-like [Patiria miniata]XP_038047878.1 alpha-N-acetyl-neuraminyl-2,3-beta-galactosyl-1,3-N-acetyl-galactosaminide alpha-2,6-sialyltransferase-like [Patiria miniata]XP_038047879.1 alpha-N-acetyl-neuraminyl-2,3-beta-galactosyl-1,3-N-acetyl-galactosaminide alpha-2,6-sialyltransferase-like [Patiria miniata]XP_038047880.1 alpha-N-acetyl-neuraminyl-2,3-beta-galactosyl-1,3-N-acetyl-galactosaminide al